MGWHHPVTELGAQGPDIPPMEAGLPRTEMQAIHKLFLAVLVRGLTEDAIGEWTGGREYHLVCELAGVEKWQAMRLRDAYANKTLDLVQLQYLFVGLNRSAGEPEAFIDQREVA